MNLSYRIKSYNALKKACEKKHSGRFSQETKKATILRINLNTNSFFETD